MDIKLYRICHRRWKSVIGPSSATTRAASITSESGRSAEWQQIAPMHCTYGFDVITTIGWQRQTSRLTFEDIHSDLAGRIIISESQFRHLYQERYLPLLASQERTRWDELEQVSQEFGLILSLDGLAPEGGEPQLWVVRELQTGVTLRSGWLSEQGTACL